MNIVVVGLGNAGTSLAIALSPHFLVVGYDADAAHVQALRDGQGRMGEVEPEALAACTATWTTEPTCITGGDLVIVTMPTPIDEFQVPDLGPLRTATETVSRHMRRNTLVVYDNTAYPGVTQDVCVPLLEQGSSLTYPQDFSVGYAAGHVCTDPGAHTLTTTKIVAGDTPEVRDTLARIYGAITRIYAAPTIKVAEAAKVLENTQRDINIALMNELSQIFCRLGIDTTDVIDAARSKWNFMDFRPGLVGGHCISVDPYYLSHKAASHGIVADMILSARHINESMPAFVTEQLLSRLMQRKLLQPGTVITILGVTFKENVKDVRNSGVIPIHRQLSRLDLTVQLIDPLADADALRHDEGLHIIPLSEARPADAIVLAVPHADFVEQGWPLIERLARPGQEVVVADIKAVLPRESRPRHVVHWRP